MGFEEWILSIESFSISSLIISCLVIALATVIALEVKSESIALLTALVLSAIAVFMGMIPPIFLFIVAMVEIIFLIWDRGF